MIHTMNKIFLIGHLLLSKNKVIQVLDIFNSISTSKKHTSIIKFNQQKNLVTSFE